MCPHGDGPSGVFLGAGVKTNFQQVFNEERISKDIDLPPEEKKKLPPPKILSDVYMIGKKFCVDIEDHRGQKWTLVALKRSQLRRKLRYFKTLPRDLIWDLLPRQPQAVAEPRPTDEKPAKKPKAKKIVEEKPATVEKPMSRLMQKMKQNKAE